MLEENSDKLKEHGMTAAKPRGRSSSLKNTNKDHKAEDDAFHKAAAMRLAGIPQLSSEKESWTTKTYKKKATTIPTVSNGDTMEQQGWSAPILETIVGATDTTTGVCAVNMQAAVMAVNELSSTLPLAILSPKNVDEKGTAIWYVAKDKDGRMQSRQRFLIQLGASPVVYTPVMTKKSVNADTTKVVLTLSKDLMHQSGTDNETWDFAVQHPKPAVRKWLMSRTDSEVLDVHNPTRISGISGQMQVIAEVGAKSQVTCLKTSGVDGVIIRPYYQTQMERDLYRVVPLLATLSLPEANRKAVWLGALAMGVVPYKRGFAIRVLATDYKQAVLKLRPEDAEYLMGQQWDISGLPSGTGKLGLLSLMKPWKCTPVYTYKQSNGRRTWIVRASSDPPFALLQLDDGIAVIKLSVPRVSKPKPIEKWQPRQAGLQRSQASVPKYAWKDVVKGTASPSANQSVNASFVHTEQLQQTDANGNPIADGIAHMEVETAAPTHVDLSATASPGQLQLGTGSPTLPASGNGTENLSMQMMQLIQQSIEAAIKPLQKSISDLKVELSPMNASITALQQDINEMRDGPQDSEEVEFVHNAHASASTNAPAAQTRARSSRIHLKEPQDARARSRSAERRARGGK